MNTIQIMALIKACFEMFPSLNSIYVSNYTWELPNFIVINIKSL